MKITDTVIAVFDDHISAETAIRKLSEGGFAMTRLSLVGKGFHTEEKVVGFYNSGNRVRFWGTRGAFWGALWGLFFGGLLLTVPVVGQVVVLGYVSALAVSVLENAIVVGGLSALGAALYGIGIPEDSVIRYEGAVKADGFLVSAHGTAEEIARAEEILARTTPKSVDVHTHVSPEVAPTVPAAA